MGCGSVDSYIILDLLKSHWVVCPDDCNACMSIRTQQSCHQKMQLHGLFPGENDISIQSLKSIKLGGSVKKNSDYKEGQYFSTLSSRLSRHWIAWALSSSTRCSWYHIACSHSSSWMPLCWILVLAFKTSHMGGKHRLGCSELPETFALISRQKPRRTGTRTLAYGSPAQWPELACFQRLMYCGDASSVCATGHRITWQQLPFNVTPLLLKNNPNWKESGYWVQELFFFFMKNSLTVLLEHSISNITSFLFIF